MASKTVVEEFDENGKLVKRTTTTYQEELLIKLLQPWDQPWREEWPWNPGKIWC